MTRNKKSITITFIMAFLFIFTNIINILEVKALENKDIKVVSNVEKISDKGIEYVLNTPKVEGLDNKNFEKKLNKDIEKEVENIIDEVKDKLKKDKNYGKNMKLDIPPYKIDVNYESYNLSKNILTVVLNFKIFTGGQYQVEKKKAYNVNIKECEYIDIDKVLKHSEAINENIKTQLDKKFYYNKKFKGIDKKSKFYFKEKTLVIYFDQNELSPASLGILEFNIPVDTNDFL